MDETAPSSAAASASPATSGATAASGSAGASRPIDVPVDADALSNAGVTFGIAGHVDHGKTSFVRCLTGIETDRLEEEQRRGISIELGFAPLTLPHPLCPITVGLVDMPGHERFVRRMIAGAVGVDAVLLIVAADEGVMPQAREHLAISELLGVRRGAIVLTKADLADEDLLELLELELSELCEGTFLADAPILRFSSRDPEPWLAGLVGGLVGLVERVRADTLAAAESTRPFRMPVDRAFHLRGRGTVATGTAATGSVSEGETLRVAPGDATFRVRGLERHGVAVPGFTAPGRLAIQLAGASPDDLPAGCVVASAEAVVVSDRFDAIVDVLATCPLPIARRSRWTLHVGTSRVEAAVVPLAATQLAPAERGFCQLHLDHPVALAAGDRFVLRGSHDDPRFGRTVAGGRILHPAPPRHRLDDASVVEALAALAGDDDEAALVAMIAIASIAGLDRGALGRSLPMAPARLDRVLARAAGSGKVRKLGQPPTWLVPGAIADLEASVIAAVGESHRAAPDRDGIERSDVARRVGVWLSPSMIDAIVDGLVRRGSLKAVATIVALPSFVPAAKGPSEALLAAVREVIGAGDLAPATGQALIEEIAARVALAGEHATSSEIVTAIEAGVRAGWLLRHGDVHLLESAFQRAVARLFAAFADRDGFDTGDLKTLFDLTRKHLIPLAELLDAAKITIRDPSGTRRFRTKALQSWQREAEATSTPATDAASDGAAGAAEGPTS